MSAPTACDRSRCDPGCRSQQRSGGHSACRASPPRWRHFAAASDAPGCSHDGIARARVLPMARSQYKKGAPTCAVPVAPAEWQAEAPTRPVHTSAAALRVSHPVADPVSVSAVRTPPPPLALEHTRKDRPREDPASVELAAEEEGAAEELAKDQTAASDEAPSGVRLSTVPPPNDFDQWFASMAPPAPSLPEVVVDPRFERRPRRWIGWLAVTLAVVASMWIVAQAVVARVRARAHAALAVETSAVPDARSTPSASISTLSTGPSGPQTAGAATTPIPPARGAADTPVGLAASGTRARPVFVDRQPGAGPPNVRPSRGRRPNH
jgi:hypothetical protein